MSGPRSSGRVESIANCPLLTALPLRVLQALGPRFEAIELDTGDLLFEKGGRSATLYIVESGDLEVEDDDRTLGRIGKGGFLCEENILRPAIHKNRARATSPSLVLTLDQASLDTLWKMEPAVAAFFQLAIGSRLITELRQANEQLVSLCDIPLDEVEHTGMRRILEVVEDPTNQ